MSFADIETVLGFTLPASARNYPAWWGNNPQSHRQTRGWLPAGWRTEEVDLAGEKVTFRKSDVSVPVDTKSRLRQPAQAAILQNLPDAPDGIIDLAVAMHWKLLGSIREEEAGKLVFPAAPAVPALYRLRLIGAATTRHYIGEAANLRRRFSNYRNPGPTQETNLRINEALRSHLAGDGQAEVDMIASDISLFIGGSARSFDLSDKAIRRLLERAALVANPAIDIESLNR